MFPSLPTIYIVATRCNSYRIVGKTHPLGWRASEAAEQKYDWGGGLAREAAKQPTIHTKRPRAKVKNWGG